MPPHEVSGATRLVADDVRSIAPRLSSDTQAMMAFESNKKSAGVAYLLWFFLGGLGGHRFYLGHSGTAATILILTLVGVVTSFIAVGFIPLLIVGMWLIVDLFLIPGMVKTHNNQLASYLGAGLVLR